MSDFAAVAESDRFPAKWAAGDAKENELVLSADFGEGTFLSGSVWESAEGDEKPWQCIFRFSQEDMGIDDQGFDTHEEAVLAVEGYFGSAVSSSARMGIPLTISTLLPLMGRSGFRTGPTSCAMLRRGRHRSGAFRHSQCVRAENVKVLGC